MAKKLYLQSRIFLICFVILYYPIKAQGSFVIGLSADMSSASSASGLAIQRGLEMALEDINATGGLLGRPVLLNIRDHRGNPSRGKADIKYFANSNNVIAIFSGLHTPVALAQLQQIHHFKIPFLIPWAAGTPLVKNGYHPNFVFRMSVNDSEAGPFLIAQARQRGFKKIGLLLEKTSWGRSNEKAMQAASSTKNISIVKIEHFHWGTDNFAFALDRLVSANVEAIIFVGNALEGAAVVKQLASMSLKRPIPILSHWGITGGNFYDLAHIDLKKVDLEFLQTFSFIDSINKPTVQNFVNRFIHRYHDVQTVRQIKSPVGTAHAYDLMRYFAKTVNRIGTTDPYKLVEGLENQPPFQGLFRNFQQFFSPNNHDALSVKDFSMAHFAPDGAIELR